MKKQIVEEKKRGRPSTGTAPLVGVRMTPEFQKPIKAWALRQADKPPLAESIRRLVAIGLAAGKSPRKRTDGAAGRAAELAGAVIDQHVSAASADEKAVRKRRLISGPSSFRGVRKN